MLWTHIVKVIGQFLTYIRIKDAITITATPSVAHPPITTPAFVIVFPGFIWVITISIGIPW
jgi:hypothetical protein